MTGHGEVFMRGREGAGAAPDDRPKRGRIAMGAWCNQVT
jgi:hypothetical protein